MAQHEHHLLQVAERANRRLDQLARFDMLTDVANRRHFDEFLTLAWGRARHDGQPISLLMMDLDHFKAYNDSQGHQQGDACLQLVAATIKACLRAPTDLLARYGGEEFVAILTQTQAAEAHVVAERIRLAVDALHIPHDKAPLGHVTISIGVASTCPGSGLQEATKLIDWADGALYAAKSMGRNCVQVAAPPTTMAPGP
jgi:diguanylate cyclase (GGDEF)-like protein